MTISRSQKNKIKDLLINKIEKKLEKYDRETKSMPFLARLIQDNEKIVAYSFIHSIATSLGMSIYEETSVIIASESSEECYRNYDVGGIISQNQKIIISNIISQLRNGEREANINKERKEVLDASSENGKFQKSGNKADLYMKKNGEEYYFEIKTVKPNIDVFEKSKTKLLEWIARRKKRINVFLALPYNPYYPEPYKRFTEVGMMDSPHDFLVGEEYWNLIGGENTFQEILEIFDEVGKKYKDKLKNKFKEMAKKKIQHIK